MAGTMQPAPEHNSLIKFLLGSAAFLFVGTVHGVLQVLPPIRAWLDSVGSPISGPGHMIDPLRMPISIWSLLGDRRYGDDLLAGEYFR